MMFEDPDDTPENLEGFDKSGGVFRIAGRIVSREEGLAAFKNALNRKPMTYKTLQEWRKIIHKDLANMINKSQQENHETRHMLNAELHESSTSQFQTPPLPPMSSLNLTLEEETASGSSGTTPKTKAVRQSYGRSGIGKQERKVKKPRRKISDDLKREVAQRFHDGEFSSALAKEYKIHTSMISAWVKRFHMERKANKKRSKYKTKTKKIVEAIEIRPEKIRKLKLKATATQDALIYLQHARDAIKEDIVNGSGSLDNPVYLFAMLALRELEKRT